MTMPDKRLLYLISRSTHALKSHLKREYAAAGVSVSPSQMGVLFLLLEKDMRPMNELGRLLDVDNSAITGLVDRMEKLSLVERRMNPEDRRQFLIGISTQGRQEAKKAGKIAHEVNRAIGDGFTIEEMRVFTRVLSGFLIKFSGGGQ